MKSKDVIFRRVGGRVVPIHVSPTAKIPAAPQTSKAETKKALQFTAKRNQRIIGAAQIVGGIGLAIGAGIAAKHYGEGLAGLKKLAYYNMKHNIANKNFLKRLPEQNLFTLAAMKDLRVHRVAAVRNWKAAKKYFPERDTILKVGAAASSALVGKGAYDFIDGMDKGGSKKSWKKEAGATAALASHALASTAYYRSLGFKGYQLLANVRARYKNIPRPFQKPFNTPYGPGRI